MTRYPIYVPTKGRFDSRYTIKALDQMQTFYYVVIEDHEYDLYSKILTDDRIIILPWSKPSEFSQLVETRNWIKKHSIDNGYTRHWQIDDNINGFERLNRNRRRKVNCDSIFRASEDFVDRFNNVAIAGFEYRQFSGGARRKKPPFKLNHRVYSVSLVNNALEYNWRGIYNDDTDLCLRSLKAGWATITFNCFLQNKMHTMSVKGGNTPIYTTGDSREKFVDSLVEQHPDVTSKVWRYGRWHHDVDYRKFKLNNPKLKEKFKSRLGEKTINNYGMEDEDE